MSNLEIASGDKTCGALFKEIMELVNSYPITTVFGCDMDGIVSVINHKEAHPYIRFYIFARSAAPVAEIRYDGVSILLVKDHSKQNSPPFVHPDQLNKEMSVLVSLIKARRNEACILETRVSYDEMFNSDSDFDALPVAKKRK